MKTSLKKIIALLLCICFAMTFCFNNAIAANDKVVDNSNIKVIQNDKNVCTVMGSYQGDELYATFNKQTKEITMQAIEKSKAKKVLGISALEDKKTTYKVKFDRAVDGQISAVITDKNTNKEYKFNRNMDKVIAQGAFAIPLIEILGELLFKALMAAAMFIIVNGHTFEAADQIVDKLKNAQYTYYMAVVRPGDTVYIGPAIDFNTAWQRMRQGRGNDVWSVDSSFAYEVALRAGNGIPPEPVDNHNNCSCSGLQFLHFHIYGHLFGTHSLYGLPLN